jgi:hypothetical protein
MEQAVDNPLLFFPACFYVDKQPGMCLKGGFIPLY